MTRSKDVEEDVRPLGQAGSSYKFDLSDTFLTDLDDITAV
jgi:hypothetical protein